jgi:tetratricopeptide (TPR) repeat protein
MATRNRSMNVQIAESWYRSGRVQLKGGKTTEAIDSFRKAATNDHSNAEYTLALASALAEADRTQEARQIVLRLRLTTPESGEVNLNLARLSARNGMVAEAVRYYHNALYGVWPADQLAQQRVVVRTELIRFLLAGRNSSQALSQLLILASDIPHTEQAHQNLGQLFLDAADARDALEQFRLVLQLNSDSEEALAGAGRAAFDLVDYASARRYLEKAVRNGDKSEMTVHLLDITNLVISSDPLAPGLATVERIRRLTRGLNFVSDELQRCIGTKLSDQSALAVLEPLRGEIDTSRQSELAPSKLKSDHEAFRTGLNLIYRATSATSEICGELPSFSRALLLIGRKHEVVDR